MADSKSSSTVKQKTRKDTPAITKNPLTTPKKSPPEKKEVEEEKPIKRSLSFNFFRRRAKEEEKDKKDEDKKEDKNDKEESKVEWNMSSLLKSTLPSMTKDVLVDDSGLFSYRFCVKKKEKSPSRTFDQSRTVSQFSQF